MDHRERWPDHEEAIRAAMDGRQSAMWTALPGYIVSYDPTGNGTGSPTVSVQPGIQGNILASDGTTSAVSLPVLPDVPVYFPRGGEHTLTFPIVPGDECLVVMASRSIDQWWQAGGIQPARDKRQHDINDGFAFVGFRTGASPIRNVSTTTTQLRSDDGAAFIELAGEGHVVNIVAPGGVNVTTPTFTVNGRQVVSGSVTAGGDVTGAGISLDSHVHTGVKAGTDATGGPVG